MARVCIPITSLGEGLSLTSAYTKGETFTYI